jgi:hypothetical protein
MPNQKIEEIFKALHAELPQLFQTSVQIALRQSPVALALVNELESYGYQLRTDFTYTLAAIPMEMIFDQNLTDADRQFLAKLTKRDTPANSSSVDHAD